MNQMRLFIAMETPGLVVPLSMEQGAALFVPLLFGIVVMAGAILSCFGWFVVAMIRADESQVKRSAIACGLCVAAFVGAFWYAAS